MNKSGSTFIETINPKSQTLLLVAYMNILLSDFNNNYLNNLFEKTSKEQNFFFLLGDFNINLWNYNVHNPTNEY